MAQIESTAIGAGRKSVGNITYRYVRGKTIVSRRVTQNNSRTAKQRLQRGAFAYAGMLGKSLRPIIEMGFVKNERGASHANFMHFNKGLMDYARKSHLIDTGLPAIANLCMVLGDADFKGKVMVANGSIGLTAVWGWHGEDIEARLYASRDLREGDRIVVGVCYSYVLVGTFFEMVRVFERELTAGDVEGLVVKNQFFIDRTSFPDMDVFGGLPEGFDNLEIAVTALVIGEKDCSASFLSAMPDMLPHFTADMVVLDDDRHMRVMFKNPEGFAAEVGDRALGAKLLIASSAEATEFTEFAVDVLSKDAGDRVNGVVVLAPGASTFFSADLSVGWKSKLVKDSEVVAQFTGVGLPMMAG